MPVDSAAAIEISAFCWVPPFARGLVRDLRVRWALEEAGLPYRERLYDPRRSRPEAYLQEQPFDQVPTFSDGSVSLFESGAIVLHVGDRCEALLPQDRAERARATTWVFAALTSVEPAVQQLVAIDLFYKDAEWAPLRRPGAEEFVRGKLGRLSAWLGDKQHLERGFTAGDLIMTTVLRILRHTDLVAAHPNLAAYQARCEARPAFERALAAQLAAFADEPAAQSA